MRAINIAIINQPNPVSGFAATYDQLAYLINFPQYRITESATGKVVNGESIYKYFPDKDPSGGGGGGGGSTLISKSINENGAYKAKDDNADGYSSVSVSVSNSYTTQDEGKVVSGGELVSQSSSSATSNGTVDTTLINSIEINVQNSYTPSDEGKVVVSSTLVQQTSDTTTQNGTVDTTTISSLTVNVPNTYAAGDEGKVVSNGALVAQGSDTVTENGTVDTTLISSLTVNVSSGGGGAEKKAVNFVDYDGTIVHSYTAAEFAELTDWPTNPSHDGLTAQGWNWSTFAKAKAYVAKYGKLDIGQKYRVTDGKTRIFIELDEYRREPVLGLGVNGSVDIDWGDGSAHTTLAGTSVSTYVSTQPHTYPSGGEYVIALTVTGTANFLAKNSVCGLLMKDGFNSNESQYYRNAIKRLFIGDSVTTIQSYAFQYCYSLSSVTIPDSVTTIGTYAFQNCCSLENVIIPDSVTTIGTYAFQNCCSLENVIIPDSVTTIGGNTFYNCSSLGSVTIPDSVTTIGTYAFQYCYSLSSVTIPDSVTTIERYAFYNCYSLGSITIPDSVTTIEGYAFGVCDSLESIIIPDSVTTIEGYAFYNCYSLGSITIPDSVTSIGSNAFQNCYSLGSIKFESATPPAIQNVNAFTGVPADCAILVKSCEYISASSYPSPSTYTYAYYDTIAGGTALPATIPDESTTSLTWYATIADLRAETNPITVGNGKEVYAKMTARTIIKNFTSSVNEVSSGTTLTTSISCSVGDTIVATFENLGGEYTLPSGWTLLGESGTVSSAKYSQRTGMAYKIAESTSESFVLTQASSGRMFTNLVNIKAGSIGLFSGFTKNEENNTIIANKPNGLVIWTASTLWWGGTWRALPSNNKQKISGSRCENFLDQSDDTTVSFITNATQESGGLAYASLVITGISEFWHYAD
jgi:hypothetical protein